MPWGQFVPTIAGLVGCHGVCPFLGWGVGPSPPPPPRALPTTKRQSWTIGWNCLGGDIQPHRPTTIAPSSKRQAGHAKRMTMGTGCAAW